MKESINNTKKKLNLKQNDPSLEHLTFKPSAMVSLGVELEFQIIDPITHDLIPRAKGLMRKIKSSHFQQVIKPEITQGMIEINSSVHKNPDTLYQELKEIRAFLLKLGDGIGIYYAGGGTHPFQKWTAQKIFPTKRFKNLAKQYRFLSKRSTVFGQHIHIGCRNGEEALYLTHALARYVPQFIALSAASPFDQGVDTGFLMSRTTDFNSFPFSGVIPPFQNWKDFLNYFCKMQQLGIIDSMKDIYWDIRPKPEFGTVEIRVFDTPLTILHATRIAAYVQTLSHYLLSKKPVDFTEDLYYLYTYNHFQAARYGYLGHFVNPYTLWDCTIGEDILESFKAIEESTQHLNNEIYIKALKKNVLNRMNDALLLKKIYKKTKSLSKLVHEQCLLWMKD